jgi:hypothetical protein
MGAAGNHRGQEQARENGLGHFATPPVATTSKHSLEQAFAQTLAVSDEAQAASTYPVDCVPKMQALERNLLRRHYNFRCCAEDTIWPYMERADGRLAAPWWE